ncbi:MAG: TlpA family protein disulfide reductase [Clostridiales bacterium]|nr:TlpA family protein disulfide reductase [Clostridiales bacterium]
MKQKKTFIITLIILVVLIAGAGIAYQKLSPGASVNNLSSLQISDSDIKTQSETQTETAEGKTAETETSAETETQTETSAETSKKTESETETEKNTKKETETESETESETQYSLAPDFTVTDVDGNDVSLLDLLDKPAIINFWNSNCPPCKMEMPDFQEMYDEYQEEIQFIMIDTVGAMGETKASGEAYVKEQKFTFPVYYDTSQDAIYTYGVSAFPTTYFIDKDGYLIAGARGMIGKETLQMGIDMILEN